MEVIQPGSTKELAILLRSQYDNGRPTYFRLSDHPHSIDLDVTFGRGAVVRDVGSKITVMTAGPILENVLEACRDLSVNLVYFHTIKPIDKELITHYKDTRILVVHDAFGLKEAICEVPDLQVTYHGMTDAFCTSYGTLNDIRRHLGLDAAGIRNFVSQAISSQEK